MDEGIFRAGEQDGHSGLVFRRVHGAVAHRHAGHVGDFISWPAGSRPMVSPQSRARLRVMTSPPKHGVGYAYQPQNGLVSPRHYSTAA